ncbi:DUF7352 domain-containing protein [Bacteroides mediterraneensis]|uniref:DUF7352 domain-containing protein n=1 Tax=Bacteroides mediterraneensis TaxID=1841856 RepID=A0ABS2EYZ8_9BACE|nr:hypothetical protein [Bacteroides mediterraneensis]MBM6759465.1 hypothetical protein [Bacteroides mediterraneensis]
MKRIFKYLLQIDDLQNLSLPVGSKILSVQAQREMPCLWALVDDSEEKYSDVKVSMYGTGHPISDNELRNKAFAGTVQIGGLVLHVFLQYDNNIQYLIV